MSQSETRALRDDWHRKPIVWRIGQGEEPRYVLKKMPTEWLYTERHTKDGVHVTLLGLGTTSKR